MLTLQALINALTQFWGDQGCVQHLGHDVETGAGTFNPATFFRCLGPEPYRAAYVEPSRRPSDGRYGLNPNRLGLFHQYQVIIKPSPANIQDLYLQSLEAIGFDLSQHDIRFVHDDWEQPTLGASGLGWEVWRDGMEVTQFTYFQHVAGKELHPVTVELAYGIERLAMTLQGVNNIFDLKWNDHVTYRQIYHQNEVEWSRYNFEEADTQMWRAQFDAFEKEAARLCEMGLPIPAYDFVMKASHAFNTLDARGVVSVTERTGFIDRIRNLAKATADSYLTTRESLGFPLKKEEEPVKISVPEPSTATPDGKSDFVLEIGCEELPATFIPIGMRSLETKLTKLLDAEKIPYDAIEVHGTPRRLTAYVTNLAYATPPEEVERRGPPLSAAYDEEGNLTKAGAGFFRSIGEEPKPKDEAVTKDSYLFATLEIPAKSTAQLLAEHLPPLIVSVDFPKKMRWGTGSIAFARPIHSIVALHGKEVIPFAVGTTPSDRVTYGHRQLNRGPISLKKASDYFDQLKKKHVLVNVTERKDAILTQLATLENEEHLQAINLEQLLPEVVNLTEWPQLTTSTFDVDYLTAPREVLISEMVHHQRYFPLVDADDNLTNRFVITADNNPTDEIRKGNTKVLSARLADGTFLFQQDMKHTLDQFNDQLRRVTYQKELGSLYDKAVRCVANVEVLHQHLPIGNLSAAKRAALYCKADLASALVGEFPELQGVIGHHYALAHGESHDVAVAIDEHWMPRGEHAPLPATPAGTLVSLADKIDNLLSCFALGLKPTSSSDPYALRRQVLGIVKIVLAGKHRLPLKEVLSDCYTQFPVNDDPDVVKELTDFFVNRIKTVFTEYGLAKDEIEAALSAGFSDIYDAFCRVQALQNFRDKDRRFPLLAEVYKRARGQLEGQSLSDLDPTLLKEPAELALHAALTSMQNPFEKAMSAYEYDAAYQLVADLQSPLADLFDNVLILAQDPAIRQNRLSLLGTVFNLFGKLLDFSKIKL